MPTEAPREFYENLITAYLRAAAELVVPVVVIIAQPALKMDHRKRLGSTRDTRYRRRSNSALSHGVTCDSGTVSCRSGVSGKIFILRK
jgi:hypothetical protein